MNTSLRAIIFASLHIGTPSAALALADCRYTLSSIPESATNVLTPFYKTSDNSDLGLFDASMKIEALMHEANFCRVAAQNQGDKKALKKWTYASVAAGCVIAPGVELNVLGRALAPR